MNICAESTTLVVPSRQLRIEMMQALEEFSGRHQAPLSSEDFEELQGLLIDFGAEMIADAGEAELSAQHFDELLELIETAQDRARLRVLIETAQRSAVNQPESSQPQLEKVI